MIHSAALYVGYAVLVIGGLAGAGTAIFGGLWWIAGKVVSQIWALDVFYRTCARILDERKAADRNQLTKWPPKEEYK